MGAKRAEKFAKFAGIFPLRRAKRIGGGETVAATLKDFDPGEFGQAEYAVEQALKFGNYGPLEERLCRPGARHLPLELDIAAKIITGKIKRPKHRIAQDPKVLQSKRWYLAFCVRVAMDQNNPLKAAVDDVAKENRVSPSKVYTAVRENPDLFIGCPQYK
jgi:hypothetical protein